MVRIHAITMFEATPQRTAERRREAPAPMMAEEMTCVLETGIPKLDASKIEEAAQVSAEKP